MFISLSAEGTVNPDLGLTAAGDSRCTLKRGESWEVLVGTATESPLDASLSPK